MLTRMIRRAPIRRRVSMTQARRSTILATTNDFDLGKFFFGLAVTTSNIKTDFFLFGSLMLPEMQHCMKKDVAVETKAENSWTPIWATSDPVPHTVIHSPTYPGVALREI